MHGQNNKMRESIGQRILSSKYSKLLITIILIVAIISFVWDLHKYFLKGDFAELQLFSDQ